MGFIGSFNHTLDPKGRVFVPKRFLASLPENEPRHFTITRGFEGCLSLYTAGAWSRTVEQMKSKAKGEREIRDFKRMIFAPASQQTIDSSGRILVPEHLRQAANLTREVVFVGMDDEIELWDLDTWTRYSEEVSPQFEDSGRGVL